MQQELRSFNSLNLDDFGQYPVWIRVRSFDFDQPWYDSSDDETFRSWNGHLPFSEARGMVIVAASMKFKDGSVHRGFVSPAREDWDAPLPARKVGKRWIQPLTSKDRHGGSPLAILGIQQPHIFLNHQTFRFWGGRLGISHEYREAFYRCAYRLPEEIFPIQFYVDQGLSTGISSGELNGFYHSVAGSQPQWSR